MRRALVCTLLLLGIAYQAGPVRASQLAPVKSDLVSQLPADTNGSINVNGVTRSFVYAVSDYAAPAAGRPLVIHLHGDGGNMGLTAAWKSAVLNDANGAVLLSAQGRNNTAGCTQWLFNSSNPDCSAWRMRMDETGVAYDDVDFINQLITKATADSSLLGTTINSQQVYVVGESRGAAFALFLFADPRTRNKIRAIVPLSGTFYCQSEDVYNFQDNSCGYVNEFGFWGPRPTLFSAAGLRAAHILDVHGQLPPAGTEGTDTAPPELDTDWGATAWAGWGNAAQPDACYTVQVSSQTEQTLAHPIGGKIVKSYAYSQDVDHLATRCANLDLTFNIVQGGGHVPSGFEPTAWCFLSTVGGTAACISESKLYLPLTTR